MGMHLNPEIVGSNSTRKQRDYVTFLEANFVSERLCGFTYLPQSSEIKQKKYLNKRYLCIVANLVEIILSIVLEVFHFVIPRFYNSYPGLISLADILAGR